MKKYEKVAQYYLGFWYLICTVDGWGYLLFGYELTGEPGNFFLEVLRDTTWFWIVLKTFQAFICVSLLCNYRPALGFILTTPISVIMVSFYVFELPELIPFGVPVVAASIILLRAFRQHYTGMLQKN